MANSGFDLKIEMHNAKKIIQDHGLDKDGAVTEFLRNTVDRFCDPYVPYGEEQGSHLKEQKTYPDKQSIKYILPYSHYHYIGNKAIGPSRPKGVKRKISNDSMKYQGSPKRGPHWDKRMMNDRGKEVCQDVEDFIIKGVLNDGRTG